MHGTVEELVATGVRATVGNPVDADFSELMIGVGVRLLLARGCGLLPGTSRCGPRLPPVHTPRIQPRRLRVLPRTAPDRRSYSGLDHRGPRRPTGRRRPTQPPPTPVVLA